MKNVLVTGGGGFIGGHLVARLRDQGVEHIRSVDQAPIDQWHQTFPDVDNQVADLQELDPCRTACEGIDTVFNLAADMGGMGFIENNKALCMLSGSDLHPHAAGRPRRRCPAVLLLLVGLRLRRRQAGIAGG